MVPAAGGFSVVVECLLQHNANPNTPNQVLKSIPVHFTLRKSAITSLYCSQFKLEKFQSQWTSLRVGSIYTQRESGTLMPPELAVCPIKKVWDIPETTKNVMTHTRAIASYMCVLHNWPQL